MYLLFDIGGTKTRIAFSQDGVSFDTPFIFPTPESYNEGISTILSIKEKNAPGNMFCAAVGGIAASFDRDGEQLVSGGKQIQNWLNKPIKHDLERAFGCPVYIKNDTMLAGLAQAHFGPAQGYKISVYVTVSTGVGGAIIVNGKIDDNTFGFEPGWQMIDAGNALCSGWSEKGYLMDYISGRSIEKNELKKPQDIKDDAFWRSRANFLAMGLHNITTIWSPEIITLGGSVMKSIPFSYLEEKYTENISKVFPFQQPILKKANFGDAVGLHGALAYIKAYKI
ncbi:MAG: ROK family protein [Candidatus Pacebacteria bacterium]|nr:ROK family protein [Candidatus Paceibacterota bacterium]